ncbi:MAG TPA: hybrid sensor histidine kinase/response regulator [Bacteroidales bacterium]|nr:hybrid sensor histidine kinase/response regulator [Bacteroidales bacterium]
MNKQAIICIDDEAIVLDALTEQLQNEFGEQYVIEVAENGDEAMEIVEEYIHNSIDIPVVIADFIMPGMKGDELLEKIFLRRPDTRNILLTGQASLQGVSNAVNKANLYRYISKPWDKNDLILTIREALRSFEQEKTILKQNLELKELNSNLEIKVDQRTRELKELNATKDKFFSIIAHDLKNPFNTLLGFSELMLINFDAYDKKQISEFIHIIHSTSKNAYSLLENLLEWSRSQTGRIELKPAKINLFGLVVENISLLKGIANNKDIKIINEVEKNAEAFADQNMITTVIRNLLTNALKYTTKGGMVKISSEVQNDMVTIRVSDTGVGIQEENLKKLFRIDTNFSTPGTEDEAGTGLGLILCREFIQKNNGKIDVKSTFGLGSEFSFTLPGKGG